MFKIIKRYVQLGFLLLFGVSAYAQQEIRIGAVYPLTGDSALAGAEIRNALELATDIINNGAASAPNLLFSSGGGLPNLKGAKIKIIFADHQGNPKLGASETERLIKEERVVAIVGAYLSNVTQAASQVAERYKVLFLGAESVAATLTQRGFKWFFRTCPNDDLFIGNFFKFLKEIEAKKGISVRQLGMFNENTLWGNETTRLETRLSAENGYNLVKTIVYPAKSAELTSQVQSLKAANPQVVLQSSYLGDAVLSMKTYKEAGFSPEMILANNGGFVNNEFIKTLGKDADYIITREVWSLDLAKNNPLIKQVNDLFKARYKSDFSGISGRGFTRSYGLG